MLVRGGPNVVVHSPSIVVHSPSKHHTPLEARRGAVDLGASVPVAGLKFECTYRRSRPIEGALRKQQFSSAMARGKSGARLQRDEAVH